MISVKNHGFKTSVISYYVHTVTKGISLVVTAVYPGSKVIVDSC